MTYWQLCLKIFLVLTIYSHFDGLVAVVPKHKFLLLWPLLRTLLWWFVGISAKKILVLVAFAEKSVVLTTFFILMIYWYLYLQKTCFICSACGLYFLFDEHYSDNFEAQDEIGCTTYSICVTLTILDSTVNLMFLGICAKKYCFCDRL